MKHGFVKVAAVTPKIRVADPGYNGKVICEELQKAYEQRAKVIVLPELCLTGYTCDDLFLQPLLLERAENELLHIVEFTRGKEGLVFLGLPFSREGKLYNVAGEINRHRYTR